MFVCTSCVTLCTWWNLFFNGFIERDSSRKYLLSLNQKKKKNCMYMTHEVVNCCQKIGIIVISNLTISCNCAKLVFQTKVCTVSHRSPSKTDQWCKFQSHCGNFLSAKICAQKLIIRKLRYQFRMFWKRTMLSTLAVEKSGSYARYNSHADSAITIAI